MGSKNLVAGTCQAWGIAIRATIVGATEYDQPYFPFGENGKPASRDRIGALAQCRVLIPEVSGERALDVGSTYHGGVSGRFSSPVHIFLTANRLFTPEYRVVSINEPGNLDPRRYKRSC